MENKEKQKIHYIANGILNPPGEKVTVNLIGGGGTGSNVLSGLAAIDKSLIALGHPGIHVTLFDSDIVSEANAARQLFYKSDIGLYKAEVLISRVNRAFGTKWIAMCQEYGKKYESANRHFKSNITISCVDTVKARKEILEVLLMRQPENYDQHEPYYWIDTGNGAKFGQVFIGTVKNISQPKSKEYETVSRIDMPGEFFKNETDKKSDGPSCSLAEALVKQDLFINKTIATYACNMFWNMFREAKLQHRGIYINLERYLTNPIPL